MRTSAFQTDKLVAFMEKNGDLSKAANDGFQSRMANLQRWAELVAQLNSTTGDKKSEEKWRKTWSDLKNNTKKKATKIEMLKKEVAKGNLIVSSSRLQLTDLEERIMAVINQQPATGIMHIVEVGLEQNPFGDIEVKVELPEENNEQSLESWNVPESNAQSPEGSPPSHLKPRPTPSPEPSRPPGTRRRRDPPPSPGPPRSPGPPPRRRRRGVTTTQSELARQTFLNSDRHWREFLMEKQRKDQELESERLRLRGIELRQQAKWQELFGQFLGTLQDISSKILDRGK